MKLGIIGLPRSGKSTVFRALLGGSDPGSGSKKSPNDPTIGVVKVEDERLDYLTIKHNPKKTTHVHVEYLDMPNLGGAGGEQKRGEQISDQFLAQLRTLDAFLHCVRYFDAAILERESDAIGDFKRLEEEMMLSDLSIIEKRLERAEKDLQKGRKELQEEVDLLKEARLVLEKGQPLRTFPVVLEKLKNYAFLSAKPQLVLVNAGQEKTPSEVAAIVSQLKALVSGQPNIDVESLYADNEAEIARLDPEEAKEFLKDLQVEESAKQRIVKKSFSLLQLIVFLTAGEKEVRAWSMRKGGNSLKAAECIHSDIARGFIRAEVVAYDDFKRAGGSMQAAQKDAKVRLEGKEYIIKDGDIILFRFNV